MSPLKYKAESKLYGRKEALKRLFRRDRGVVGYVILAIACAYSIGQVSNEGSERRQDIAESSEQVLRASCERGNNTRNELRIIIRNGIPPIKGYADRGLLTPDEAAAAIAQSKDALKRLHDVNCSNIHVASGD